jgi:hypothetical protein
MDTLLNPNTNPLGYPTEKPTSAEKILESYFVVTEDAFAI